LSAISESSNEQLEGEADGENSVVIVAIESGGGNLEAAAD
jgi:hypothetical protein